MALGGRTRVLMADWSVKEITAVRPGDMVFGYIKTAEMQTYTLFPSPVISNARLEESLKSYRYVLSEGTRLVCDSSQKFWVDRLRNGRVWSPPSKPGFDPNYKRASLTRIGHTIRGIGKAFVIPSQSEEWRKGRASAKNLLFSTAHRFVASLDETDSEVSRGFLSYMFDSRGSIIFPQCGIGCSTEPLADAIEHAIRCVGFNTCRKTTKLDTRINIDEDPLDQIKFLFHLDLQSDEKRGDLAMRGLRGARLELISVEEGQTFGMHSMMTEAQSFIAEGLVCKGEDIRNTGNLTFGEAPSELAYPESLAHV